MTDDVEHWLPVPGYVGLYEVSDAGRVRGLDRTTVHTRKGKTRTISVKGVILKPGPASNGYPTVNMCPGEGCKRRNYPVHQLVLLAFRGPPPEGFMCLHIKNNKSNVRLDNLYYGTFADNLADTVRDNGWDADYYRKRHWDNRVGYESGRKKLRKFSDADVLNIRKLLAEGKSNRSIAIGYGVDAGAVRAIRVGRTYKF